MLTARSQQLPGLPVGKPVPGTTSEQAPATYQFTAATAGLLTVAVHGTGDLSLILTAADGTLIDVSDGDLFGSRGNEQLFTTIREPGTYKLGVEVGGGSQSKYEIGSSWLPFPAFTMPPDPDKHPSQAQPLPIGKPREDTLDGPAGDLWDWFVLTPATDGTLTVTLRPTGDDVIDVVLELFLDDDFTTPVVRSDQDLQGNAANEAATIDVKAGQKVFAKVSSSSRGSYRISSSLIRQFQ
jgi:hypothetical protein